MPHLDLTTTSASAAALGANRFFAMVTTDPTAVVHVLAADTSGITAYGSGVLVQELTAKAPRTELRDGSTFLYYIVKSGSVTGAVWVDGDPPLTVGPVGPNWTVVGPKTSAYTANVGELVKVDTTSGGVTITLPTAVGIAGQRIAVCDATGQAATHAITIATTSTQTVNGSAPATIAATNGHNTYVSDGANWILG